MVDLVDMLVELAVVQHLMQPVVPGILHNQATKQLKTLSIPGCGMDACYSDIHNQSSLTVMTVSWKGIQKIYTTLGIMQ